jgi:hypothetical protein
MAYWFGSLVGALIAALIFRTLVWWLLGKLGKMPDEVPRAVTTALITYPLMIAVGGWGNANGGPWNPGPFWFTYAVGVAFWFVADLWRVVQARKRARRS